MIFVQCLLGPHLIEQFLRKSDPKVSATARVPRLKTIGHQRIESVSNEENGNQRGIVKYEGELGET